MEYQFPKSIIDRYKALRDFELTDNLLENLDKKIKKLENCRYMFADEKYSQKYKECKHILEEPHLSYWIYDKK
ncbi:hypothetical protein [Oceanivirga salmonicida]|uniref:hypothetical protein n=1 Tax=Oceanivirga salmonicida TaxID=1769291 RepID=UPI0012E1CA2E|nr:hypothetical protein [Oceanivirga salmonicida]